jgi:hypothetical protein
MLRVAELHTTAAASANDSPRRPFFLFVDIVISVSHWPPDAATGAVWRVAVSARCRAGVKSVSNVTAE